MFTLRCIPSAYYRHKSRPPHASSTISHHLRAISGFSAPSASPFICCNAPMQFYRLIHHAVVPAFVLTCCRDPVQYEQCSCGFCSRWFLARVRRGTFTLTRSTLSTRTTDSWPPPPRRTRSWEGVATRWRVWTIRATPRTRSTRILAIDMSVVPRLSRRIFTVSMMWWSWMRGLGFSTTLTVNTIRGELVF